MKKSLFTPEEFEAIRIADEEIDQETEKDVTAAFENEEIDKWLDELVFSDTLDNKQLSQRRRRRKYSAAYRAEHKEEIAAKMAAYRAEHKEEIAAKKAAYYAEHKDEIAAKMAAYRAEHREKWNAYQREYQKKKRRREKVITGNISRIEKDGDHTCAADA